MSTTTSKWIYAAVPAVIMTLLAIYPLVHLRVIRGHDWNGSLAYLQGDELIYAAYVNSLRVGLARRNNPYTGEQDRADTPVGESAYSIQFLPAYAIALSARALGLSTAAAFAVLLIIAAICSSLVLFWLISVVTGDDRLATAGVLFVLCLGSIPTLWGLLQILRGLPPDFSHLRFLRRFEPATAFPFLFAFCGLVWRMLTTRKRTTAYLSSLSAVAVFVILVFSYFYFWTAALAWVACVGLVWLIGRPDGWRQSARPFVVMMVLMAGALLPYGWLLSQRAPNQVAVTILTRTHAPDLLRVPQLASAALLIFLLVLNKRGHFSLRRPSSLFVLSFVLLPLILFNQQIISGLSLQPTHYETFVANYTLLLATVLIAGILSGVLTPGWKRIFRISLIPVAILSVGWGVFEVTSSARKFTAACITRDEATPAARLLGELRERERAIAESTGYDRAILAPDPVVADYLSTIYPQPMLWAPHINGFGGITTQDDRQRLLSLLYYTGQKFDAGSPEKFAKLNGEKKFFFAIVLGRSRLDRSVTNNWQPVQPEEYETAARSYADFQAAFNRETAAHPLLGFVLTAIDKPVDFSNLDRWYERDQGEQIGKYVLYRVKLRP